MMSHAHAADHLHAEFSKGGWLDTLSDSLEHES